MKKIILIAVIFIALGTLTEANAQCSVYVGIEEKAYVSGGCSIQFKAAAAALVLGLLD